MIKVEMLTENIPYEEITEIVHKAYAEHRKNNLAFAAIDQTVEMTKSRIGDGVCLVAMDGEQIVGTVCCRIRRTENDPRWYITGPYAEVFMFAVIPEYRNSMAGTLLMLKTLRYLKKAPEGIQQCLTDTSVEAENLVKAYKSAGLKIVDFVSWPGTNYYSYVFCFPFDPNQFTEEERERRLAIATRKCKAYYHKDGTRTFIGKVARRLSRITKKRG